MQTCRACGEGKPLGDFYTRKRGYVEKQCRACRAAKSREWCREHREETRAYTKKWRLANPESRKKTRRGSSLATYGLTHEDYDRMLTQQRGVCAVCGSPPTANRPRLCVDHNHVTGVVRSLLCDRCNIALGHVGDDPQRLRQLAEYLENHQWHKSA